jgi:hypothetical protein
VKDRFGPAHSLTVYSAFFLGTSINTAWLSVATAVQLLIALKLGPTNLVPVAVLLAVLVTSLGAFCVLQEHDTGGVGQRAAGYALRCDCARRYIPASRHALPSNLHTSSAWLPTPVAYGLFLLLLLPTCSLQCMA